MLGGRWDFPGGAVAVEEACHEMDCCLCFHGYRWHDLDCGDGVCHRSYAVWSFHDVRDTWWLSSTEGDAEGKVAIIFLKRVSDTS